jgi:hypothetical protein
MDIEVIFYEINKKQWNGYILRKRALFAKLRSISVKRKYKKIRKGVLDGFKNLDYKI